MQCLWPVVLLVMVRAQFLHFPVTTGRSDTRPHLGKVLPTGRPDVTDRKEGTEALLALMECDGVTQERPRGRMLSSLPVVPTPLPQTEGRGRVGRPGTRGLAGRRARTGTRQKEAVKKMEEKLEEEEVEQDRLRVRGRLIVPGGRGRGRKLSKSVRKPMTATSSKPTKQPEQRTTTQWVRGEVPRRAHTQAITSSAGSPKERNTRPFVSIQLSTNIKPERTGGKNKKAFSRKITIKKQSKERFSTVEVNEPQDIPVKELISPEPFLPTVPPKRRKFMRKSSSKQSSFARKSKPLILSIPKKTTTTRIPSSKRPDLFITRKPLTSHSTARKSLVTSPSRKHTPTSALLTRKPIVTPYSLVPATTPLKVNAYSRRQTTATTITTSTITTTTALVTRTHASPRPAVAVAVLQPSTKLDEVPSPVRPLDTVLSIINMRKDAKSDSEEVIVAPYDIEQALSHAELTWAQDPFRNSVSMLGKPVFDIDYTKNTGDSDGPQQISKTQAPLHGTPKGRNPLSVPFARHLGRVETKPSASNRLRQSFADEGPFLEPTSRPNPESRRKTLRTEGAKVVMTDKGRGAKVMLEDRGEEQETASSEDNISLDKKSVAIETLTWTPALLKKNFDKEKFQINARQPTNPQDVFVYFRN